MYIGTGINIKINVVDREHPLFSRESIFIPRETEFRTEQWPKYYDDDGQYNIVTGGFHFSFPIICHFRIYTTQLS